METQLEQLVIKLSSTKMNKADKEREIINFVKGVVLWTKSIKDISSEETKGYIIEHYSKNTGIPTQTLKRFTE